MVSLLEFASREELLKQSVNNLYENPAERDRIFTKLQDQGTVRIEGMMRPRKEG